MEGLTRHHWQICLLPEPAHPLHGLAAEGALFDSLPAEYARLLLWRSTPSVVIGKNQIPWRECDPERIAAEGGAWVRRQSGGGTVYHDPGNLCYSVMLPRDGYCADEVGRRIAAALHPFGLPVEVGPRHILQMDGRKVSGTAFCHRRDRVLHHGTLLIAADLDRLSRWLTPAITGITTAAVASVPSPVVNLAASARALTVPAAFAALAAAFGPAESITVPTGLAAQQLSRFTAEDWHLGLTPAFSLAAADGPVHIRQGRIAAAPPSLQHLLTLPYCPSLFAAAAERL